VKHVNEVDAGMINFHKVCKAATMEDCGLTADIFE
jgi:hypothetical protein